MLTYEHCREALTKFQLSHKLCLWGTWRSELRVHRPPTPAHLYQNSSERLRFYSSAMVLLQCQLNMLSSHLPADTVTSFLTIIFPRGKTTHIPTHGYKTIKIVLQALIWLLVQTRNDAELCPVKGFLFLVIHNTEGRHGSIEVGLFSSSPPES